MNKNHIIALAACAFLTLAVFVGSTGFGYTIYRPLRNYDIYSLLIAWVGTLFYMVRGARASSSGKQG
jgi:ABC-type proline/glycine betaine transport system permease subunit